MDKSDSLKVLKTAVTYFKPSHLSGAINLCKIVILMMHHALLIKFL